MARVAVDMWGSSIVAFSGCSCTELFLSIRNLLAAKIAEELPAKLGCVETAEGGCPDMLRTVNILERP